MSGEAQPQVFYHPGAVSREDRGRLFRQTGATVWFTGLSGSGKSTVAVAVEQYLVRNGHAAYVLDGDNVRLGLNAGPKVLTDTRGYSDEQAKRFGLGFSAADREENVRRIGEVAKLFQEAGFIAMTAFISPYRADRDKARAIAGDAFIEVYVNASLEACEARDPKGLYQKARAGVIPEFTGISAPYEAPENPELTVDTAKLSLEESVAQVIACLETRGVLAK